MIQGGLRRHTLNLLLLFSMGFGCFSYGLAVEKFQIFPYIIIRDAATAALALREATRPNQAPVRPILRKPTFAPRARHLTPTKSDELILVSGGAEYLRDVRPEGCLAWLMDRSGNVKHSWKYDPSVWNDLQKVTIVPGVSGAVFPVGMHLFDNGDLLVNYQGATTFPFAVGMARFDKDSNLLWKRELLSHHWFSVADDGRIYVPALRILDAPLPIGNTMAMISSDTGKIHGDVILVLDENGELLEEISMLDAIVSSGWAGLLVRGEGGLVNSTDPLHLNDVQLISPELAKTQPWLKAGDLLVSFRNINAVGILDGDTRRFKWMTSGATVQQHSPRSFDGGILVLDNRGGNKDRGITQLVKLELPQGKPTTVFPRDGLPLPELCATMSAGHLDIHRNQNRLLLTLTQNGAVWEVDPHTGEVLWEYVYVHPDQLGNPTVIYTAKYVYEPHFLN